jgi:hypothetical protein
MLLPSMNAPPDLSRVRGADECLRAVAPRRRGRLKAAYLLIVLLGMPACGHPAADAFSSSWNFVATLDGKPIGSHRFDVNGPPAAQTVDSRATFDVSFFKIPVYHYRIHDEERWRGDCLTALRSETDDDGKPRRVDQTFEGECVMSFAYWNPRLVTQTRLVNPQTGEIEPVSFERVADRALDIAGQAQLAHGWLLRTPQQRISIWLSARTGRWIGLDADVKGGHTLSYRPLQPPPGSAP